MFFFFIPGQLMGYVTQVSSLSLGLCGTTAGTRDTAGGRVLFGGEMLVRGGAAAQEPASSSGTCSKVYGLPAHGATFLWEAGGGGG